MKKFLDRVSKCQHEFYDNYIHYVKCETPYCRGFEYHCKKCKAYIIECGCGFCNGISGWPDKRYQNEHERMKERTK